MVYAIYKRQCKPDRSPQVLKLLMRSSAAGGKSGWELQLEGRREKRVSTRTRCGIAKDLFFPCQNGTSSIASSARPTSPPGPPSFASIEFKGFPSRVPSASIDPWLWNRSEPVVPEIVWLINALRLATRRTIRYGAMTCVRPQLDSGQGSSTPRNARVHKPELREEFWRREA